MRRFFRFTIRDLLWLTLVVAVALGWLVRELYERSVWDKVREWQQTADALERVLKEEGWAVERRSLDLHVYPLDVPNRARAAEYRFRIDHPINSLW